MGGGGCGWWNQLSTFDTELKFTKILNSHVWLGGGIGGTNFQLLMLSSNLLKSKIPMSGGGGGGVGGSGTNFQLLMLSPNLLTKKIFFAKNFLSFRTKSITVLFWTLSTKWFPYTKYRRTTIKEFLELSFLNTHPCLMLSRIIPSTSNVAERYTDLLLPNHFYLNSQVIFCSRDKVVSGVVKR